MQLSLTFLGPFHAAWGQSSLDFATDSARALLAYLAVEGDRPHMRSTLATQLWADRPQEIAHSNLRQTLARLRKALQMVDSSPAPLLITPKTVQFQRAAATIDVLNFEQLYNICGAHEHSALATCPACITHMHQAANLYRGDFLQDLYLQRSHYFEEWMLFKREQLQRQALEMLYHLTIHAGESADYPGMIDFATRQLALAPWREEAHRQMMWALAASGQTSAALAQYATCCRVLAEELDVKPAAETSELYERIRLGTWMPQESVHVRQEATAHIATPVPTPVPTPLPIQSYQPLAEVPSMPVLFGRQHELAQVVAWLASERCQVVAVLGMGGVGKTTLAASVAQAVSNLFDTVIWRSLLNAPPIDETLRSLLQLLGNYRAIELPASLDEQLALLLSHLGQQRCLLVLDNLESVLNQGQGATYRPGYDGYSQLVQRLAEGKHKSSLLLTSRERPKGLARLEEDFAVVRSLRLDGLDATAGQELLSARGLRGERAQMAKLVTYYSGNPLALKVVIETVHDLFGGDIAAFLASDATIFDDIRTVLDQQFAVLSPLEQELLFWLAVEREPVALQVLRDNLLHPQPPHLLMEALRGLERRSLLEQALPARPFQDESQTAVRFMLQNVVMEYLSERLIEDHCDEIESGRFVRFHSHALLKARAKEYVRRSQTRMILEPVATRLVARLGKEGWTRQVQRLLTMLRDQVERQPSYAPGNLLNLLLHAGVDIQGYDFSRLSILQAHLQGVQLRDVDFREADFRNTVFTHLFGRILAFHLDNQGQMWVAGSAGDELRVWRIENGQSTQEYPVPNARVVNADFSPDGRILATIDPEHTVCLWDVSSGHFMQRLVGHTLVIWAVAFTPDGALVATGGADNTVRVWEVHSGRCLYTLSHTTAVTALAFTADGGTLASGSVDGSMCVWDLSRGTLRQMIQAHEDEVHVLLFDPAGQLLVSGSHDATIRVWQGGGDQPIHTMRGRNDAIRTMVMSADGRIVASGGGGPFIELWDIQAGQALHTMADLDYEALLLTFSADGRLLASVNQDPTVTLWEAPTWQRLETLQIYTNPIHSLAFSPDGERLFSGSADGTLCLWAPRSGSVVKTFRGHAYGVTRVAFSPDGETLASGSDDCMVCVWQAQSTQPLYRWQGHTGRVECLQFSPTGEFLASASKRTLRLWNVHRGQATHVLTGHRERILTCAFHPAGKLLASGGMDKTICLWSVENGERRASLYGHTNAISGLIFSPDGRLLVSSSYDCTLRFWDGESGQALDTVITLETIVLTMAFHPNEPVLALGCADHSIRLWHLPSGRVLELLYGHSGAVRCIAYSPDGRLLASCSVDESIRLWDTTNGSCVQTLRSPCLYEGMKITGATGISKAQKMALKMLGAVDDPA